MNLAVIMSVHIKDCPAQLGEAIQSLLSQTMSDFSLFLMIDGTLTDELYNVLNTFNDNRINIRRKTNNEGLSRAMNDLLGEIIPLGYKYIARMDADDISLPRRFERQIDFLEKNPNIDSCGTFAIEINEDGKHLFDKDMPVSHEDCVKFFKRRSCYIHPTVMFRPSFFEKAGLYPEDTFFCEDVHLWLNGFKNGAIFHNIPEYLLLFRINKGFYARRKGLKYARTIWKTRLMIVREMGYGISGYIYASLYSVSKLLPRIVLKYLYKYCR